MWNIILHPKVVISLKHLKKDAASTLFLFLNDSLPTELNNKNLTKIKVLNGIYFFLKETSQGKVHLFIHIDFEKKLIKVLHLYLRHREKTSI